MSYISRRPSPSVPPSHQKPTTVASSLPHAGISLKSVHQIEGLICDKYVTLGAPGVGLITFLQGYYALVRVSVRKVYPLDFLRGRCPLASLQRAPQSGNDRNKGHPMMCWCLVPIMITPPPPPSYGWGGWPCCAQLHFSTLNWPRATQPQGGICNEDNVPSGGVSPYTRVPVLLLTKCRPLLTMRGVCDMAGRACSPSSTCWCRVPGGQRGLSGLQMLSGGPTSLSLA